MHKLDYTIFIGRFQPCHTAHIEIIRSALKQSERVIVLIGSAFQPRTTKNPFTWQERDEMIRASLTPAENARVDCFPLRDKMYNDNTWAKQVQDIVGQIARDKNVGIIGHSKDESSYYLKMFPQWKLIDVDNINDVNATDIRDALFSTGCDINFDTGVGTHLLTPIHDYLRAFALRPEFEQLVREYQFINQYKQAWARAPYPPTFVTVDAIVIQSGHVLLVRRRAEPGKGLWAVPGGFLGQQERLVDAAIRELREETKVKVPDPVLRGSIKDSHVFDHPNRSSRGRTVTHGFLIELPPGELPKVKGSDDADKARWIPLSAFAKMEDQMFEDHYHIVNYFLGEV
jgi:bifunctional NMN adenylyltransferase/nudix hydrolase